MNVGYYYTSMEAYTAATKKISYIDVIGISYVDFFLVFSEYDYGFDYSFEAVVTTVDTESNTWYYQSGDHYVYDEGDQYRDGYYSDQSNSSAFEYNFQKIKVFVRFASGDRLKTVESCSLLVQLPFCYEECNPDFTGT